MTAITKVDSSAVAVQAQALDVALRAAATLKSARGLLPESLKTEGEIVAVLLAGQELGLPPMAAIRGLQVVRGKVIISYDTMIALLRRAGYRIEWLKQSATEATLRLTAPDGSTHTETWTAERAKRAGLWGAGTWAKYPETMLRARCVSSAARAFAADVLAGVYIAEAGEAEEIAGVRHAPVRSVRSERADETPHPQSTEVVIDGEVVDERGEVVDLREGSCGEVVPEPEERPAPAKLSECRDEADLCAWCRKYGERVVRRGRSEEVLAHAERVGVSRESVLRWLGAGRD